MTSTLLSNRPLAPSVSARSATEQAATFLALVALMYALLVCAWQCDDAYITFRSVRNFWSGLGLTWNPDERVQAYTHPLWMLLSLIAYGVTHELFFSMTVVAIACTLATLLALARLCPAPQFVGTVLVLVASCAFIEYSVCGLENPLLNLWLVSSILVSRTSASPRTEWLRGMCLSGVFLTRADAVLLVVPLWLWTTIERRSFWRSSLVGLLPCVLWEVFSLVYYGAFVPNTALAKLNVDIPVARLALEGVRYLGDSLVRDPITLAATTAALLFAVVRGGARERLLAIGAACYLFYVVRIGGDFMSGRFLGAPLLVALCAANLSATSGEPNRLAMRLSAAVIALALGYALAWPHSPLRSTLAFGRGAKLENLSNERAYYYQATGLLPVLIRYRALRDAGLPVPWTKKAALGLNFEASNHRVFVSTDAGFIGYHAGAKIVIDPPAIADPLLARIRFKSGADGFRVGHYERKLPAGYLESREQGRNRIESPALHEAYDAIRLVVGAPLFSAARWIAIWRLNTGYFDSAFERS